ncbi:MAG: CRISPR-associated protein Cas4 [Veillonellaceae bacterium]|nr:CRISPR-associated protein Cas4 [Veillonellaceae bacterium]
MVNITGTLIWYYYICKREVWLMAHQIESDQNNDFLIIGKSIGENSYPRNHKEIRIDNIVMDMVNKKGGNIIISEIKKSSHFLESAKMQVAFYLSELKKKGVTNMKGELRFPLEKKSIEIILTIELENKLNQAIKEINEIVRLEIPPLPQRIVFCKKCSYYELCWV